MSEEGLARLPLLLKGSFSIFQMMDIYIYIYICIYIIYIYINNNNIKPHLMIRNPDTFIEIKMRLLYP